MCGEECESKGLEDDEDYMSTGRQKRAAAFLTTGDMEEQWRLWEEEPRSGFLRKRRRTRRRVQRPKTKLRSS